MHGTTIPLAHHIATALEVHLSLISLQEGDRDVSTKNVTHLQTPCAPSNQPYEPPPPPLYSPQCQSGHDKDVHLVCMSEGLIERLITFDKMH